MRILLLGLFLCSCNAMQAQFSAFGGYAAAHYLHPEPIPQVIAAKFNLGWELALSQDQRLINMKAATGNSYSTDKPLEWGTLAKGATFGFSLMDEDKQLGIMMRISFLNNKYSGERTNLSTHVKEKLALKTKSTGVSLNFLYLPNPFVQPFAGLEVGRNTFRYWYDNGTENIKNQKIGYRPTISSTYKPGGRGFNMRLNAGVILRIFDTRSIGAKAIIQYQFVIPRINGSIGTWNGETDTPVTPDYYFKHDNVSLSLVLSIH